MADTKSETVPVPKLVFTVLSIFLPMLTAFAGWGVKVQMGMHSQLSALTVKADRALEMQGEINTLRVQLRDLERQWDRKFGTTE